MTAHSSSTPHPQKQKDIQHPSLASAMASVSSGSRDCHQGEASMEAKAQEMSRLTARVADMSRHAEVAAERSRRAAEAARRSRRAVDAADWSGRAAKAAEMSRVPRMQQRCPAAPRRPGKISRGQATTVTGACMRSSIARWIRSPARQGCKTT